MLVEPEKRPVDINTEIRELSLKRLDLSGEKLQEVDRQIAELLKIKMQKSNNFRDFHNRMHEAAEKADQRVIQGINSD